MCRIRIKIYLLTLAAFFLIIGSVFAYATNDYTIENCIQKAETYENEGLYIDAISQFEKCLLMLEDKFGLENVNSTDTMLALAQLYTQTMQKNKGLALAEKAMEIKTIQLGITHPDLDKIRKQLVYHYQMNQAYDKIEKIYLEAIEEKVKKYGKQDIELTFDWIELGKNYRQMGRYNLSEEFFLKVLKTREEVLGPEHVLVADALKEMAALHFVRKGSSPREIPLAKEQAEKLLLRARAIKEKKYGVFHLEVADILDSQAMLFSSNREQVHLLRLKSLEIREKVLGFDHPELMLPIMFLAQSYQQMGDFEKAESLYLRSRKIAINAHGPVHPFVSVFNGQLANIYQQSGDPKKSVPLYEEQIEIAGRSYGENSIHLLAPLQAIASLYLKMGFKAESEKYLKKAQAINTENTAIATQQSQPEDTMIKWTLGGTGVGSLVLGMSLDESYDDYLLLKNEIVEKCRNHTCPEIFKKANKFIASAISNLQQSGQDPRVINLLIAQLLTEFGKIFSGAGSTDQAVQLYQEAISIFQNEPSELGYFALVPLRFLADIYFYNRKHLEKAEEYYNQCIEISKKEIDGIPVAAHPGDLFDRLAIIAWILESYDKAYLYLQQAVGYLDETNHQIMGFAPERLQLTFAKRSKDQTDAIIDLAYSHLTYDRQVVQDVYNVILRRKGLLLERLKHFQNIYTSSDDPLISKIFKDIQELRAQLTELFFSEKNPQETKRLRDKLEKLEKNLIQISPEYSLKQKVANATFSQVVQSLPKDSALIEFYQVALRKGFDLKAPANNNKNINYFAFVLHAKMKSVDIIDLGSRDIIDQAIILLRKNIEDPKDVSGLNTIISSKTLHGLTFQPIQKYLKSAKNIFIAPDGNLSLIPFEILQNFEGKFLIEDYTFNYITSGRDFLAFDQKRSISNKSLLIGDPDFDLKVSEKQKILKSISLFREKPDSGYFRSKDLIEFKFQRIPGTRREVEAIAVLLGDNNIDLYTDKKALEEVLFEKESPRFLHIATHGFFLQNLEKSQPLGSEDRQRGVGGVKHIKPENSNMSLGSNESSLLRSGFVLAGANNSKNQGQDLNSSIGIVTAEKILGLNLRGTEMVVLSGCDTGLGDVRVGEGIYGLRRAFMQAGTESLVMSMWSVPDKETKELMVQFYKNIQAGKNNKSQALRLAALKEMAIVADRYGTKNPKFWGAFVFLGKP